MQARRCTDEELSAWVDGELGAGERAEIEVWLRAHPEDAERVREWAADREALAAAYAAVAREPVPPKLAQVVRRESATGLGAAAGWRAWPGWAGQARWPGSGLVAAAMSLFLLGAAVGAVLAWQWQQRAAATLAQGKPGAAAATLASQGWLQRAAFAHSVYTPEMRHAVEAKAQEEHLARWLTRRIDAPVKLFDLRGFGFDLVGGRLLPDGAGKSAQLMYQDGQGKRVTVYLRKPEPGTDTAFRYERQGALGMFYWVEEKTGFALVGDLPKERLLALAKSIYDQDAVLPAPSLTPPGAAASAAASAAQSSSAAPAAPGSAPAK